MPSLTDISQSVVLVRADLNLPSLRDLGRVKATVPTVLKLLEKQNKVVLISHWGRPEGFAAEWSLQQMVPVLQQELGQTMEFVDQYQGFELASQQIRGSTSQVFLLENTRFQPAEQAKDKQTRRELAAKYATLGDYFVDEAFAVSHRQEATNCELKELLPHALGLNFEQEIQHLDHIKYRAEHPYMVIISGSKLETKLPLIERFLDKADHVLLGGMICFTFVTAKRQLLEQVSDPTGLEDLPDIADSQVEVDFLPRAMELLQQYDRAIVLPSDFQYYTNDQGQRLAYDIGPKTVDRFGALIQEAKTVFWNGPLGVYEIPPYNQGTLAIARLLAEQKGCYVVTGGGDVNSAVPQEYLDKFAWVSTGGGATLEYLSRD